MAAAAKKVEIIFGKAYITEKNHIQVGENIYQGEHILIASGSKTSEPLLENAITSDELLEMKEIPKSLLIIGGGVIAVEFAHIFNSLGTEVTMCLRSDRILRKWEKEIAVTLTQNFKRRGIKILSGCSVSQMKEIEAEVIFSAIGRNPYYEEIFDPSLGIAVDNGIIVDEYGRTNVSGIYAAGDCISGSTQLAHIAMEQGERVVKHIRGEKLKKFPAVVSCIYTEMETASVGLTENEAKEKGIACVTGKCVMSSNARTMIATKERGFIKLVAETDSGRIIGATFMCERASDLCSEIALAINSEMTVFELAQSRRPHPTFCEEISQAVKNLMEKF